MRRDIGLSHRDEPLRWVISPLQGRFIIYVSVHRAEALC